MWAASYIATLYNVGRPQVSAMHKVNKYFGQCHYMKKCPKPPPGLLKNRELNTPPKVNIALNRDFRLKHRDRCKSECPAGV